MRRLLFTEFTTQSNVPLSLEERDAVRRLHPGMRMEPTLGLVDRYNLTPDQHIGIVCHRDLVLEIQPKIPISSVLFLLSYACSGIKWATHLPTFAPSLTLTDVLAILLAKEVQRATRRGLLHGYWCQDETLQSPRGRIRFEDQLRRHYGIVPPVEVRHDLFTTDIIENRVLLGALTLLSRLPLQSGDAKRELSRAQQVFGEVNPEYCRSRAVPTVAITPLNKHYETALALATIVLRSRALDVGTGAARASSFLVDMNKAFEAFLRRALRDELAGTGKRLPERYQPLYLDEKGRIPLRPDLCIIHGQHVVWVGDAKYKRLQADGYSNADLYQLLAYTIALKLQTGTLIYAAGDGMKTVEHTVAHGGKQLRIMVLDLTAAPAKILAQIRALAQTIPNATEPIAA